MNFDWPLFVSIPSKLLVQSDTMAVFKSAKTISMTAKLKFLLQRAFQRVQNPSKTEQRTFVVAQNHFLQQQSLQLLYIEHFEAYIEVL